MRWREGVCSPHPPGNIFGCHNGCGSWGRGGLMCQWHLVHPRNAAQYPTMLYRTTLHNQETSYRDVRLEGQRITRNRCESPSAQPSPLQGPRTFDACGVEITWTVLGLTPLALGRLQRANLLFLRPLSPLGKAPLYLQIEMKGFTYLQIFKVLSRQSRRDKGKDSNGHKELPTKHPTKGKGCKTDFHYNETQITSRNLI